MAFSAATNKSIDSLYWKIRLYCIPMTPFTCLAYTGTQDCHWWTCTKCIQLQMDARIGHLEGGWLQMLESAGLEVQKIGLPNH